MTRNAVPFTPAERIAVTLLAQFNRMQSAYRNAPKPKYLAQVYANTFEVAVEVAHDAGFGRTEAMVKSAVAEAVKEVIYADAELSEDALSSHGRVRIVSQGWPLLATKLEAMDRHAVTSGFNIQPVGGV